MNFPTKLGTLIGALALLMIPATAGADPGGPSYNPSPKPKPSPPSHAKAYGRHCQGESKKHVKGERGTAFSRCVTAMAKADKEGRGLKPRKACKGLSKKHVKGERGTEFSRCVKAAAQLRREQRREEREATTSNNGRQPEGVPAEGKGKGPDYVPSPPLPGPKAGLPEKARAYGRYCQGESRKHVKGERGTAFSRCVTAMAKAAQGERVNRRRACKGLSKKHVKGERGTEFSRCVKAAAQLKKNEGDA